MIGLLIIIVLFDYKWTNFVVSSRKVKPTIAHSNEDFVIATTINNNNNKCR